MQTNRAKRVSAVALAVGMSVWGVIEYFGKVGVLPITPQAWTNDPLGKAVSGALSSADSPRRRTSKDGTKLNT